MLRILLYIFFVLIGFGCIVKNKKKPNEDNIALKMEMIQTDKDFSAMSKAKGLREAYMEFIDDNGVLLRPGEQPLIEGDAINFITQSNDTTSIMTWKPQNATIAVSGDLGYTYGIYVIESKKGEKEKYGTYVTIWKKQANGKWKFALASGNEDIE